MLKYCVPKRLKQGIYCKWNCLQRVVKLLFRRLFFHHQSIQYAKNVCSKQVYSSLIIIVGLILYYKKMATLSSFSYFCNSKKMEDYFLVYSVTFLKYEKFMFKTSGMGGRYFLVYLVNLLMLNMCVQSRQGRDYYLAY